MEHEIFEKIEKKIKNEDFYSEFKSAANIAKKTSFVGNLFSILFAYFFVYDIVGSVVLEPTFWTSVFVITITLIILIGSESIKRFVFDKFTKSFIRNEYKFQLPETKILGLVSILLITLSFYLSLNGAKEYANKGDEIKDITSNKIEYYEDSIKSIYNDKLSANDSIINVLVAKNNTYDNEIKSISERIISIEGNDWSANKERKTYKDLVDTYSKDKDRINNFIEEYNNKNRELKDDMNNEIKKYSSKETEKASDTIDEVSSTPFRFLVFSIIIEFVIIFGIWFINYFDNRSYNEHKEKRKKDPKYKQFLLWKDILDVFYTGDVTIGHFIPFKSELVKMLKINSVNIQNKELDDAYKIMTQLGILLNKGKRKELLVEYDDAVKKIKEHFKIK